MTEILITQYENQTNPQYLPVERLHQKPGHNRVLYVTSLLIPGCAVHFSLKKNTAQTEQEVILK
ncbi:MAG: hypothetical protein HOM14_00915 [Gammaproteobacteria bacterium]|nr:hypothetical protein [Gammaproteobacteria bacterium]MBT6456047.1 hypothetical protein [Gammaproteobacteria bacterium]MBT6549896.1 hypothetical protein [Gammaproteobacteria bacterium]MBT6704085.1 hypothetical protein [Gammaproteobacteria bacterium]MBT7045420.1 hypothetical protein [Gammaproteobacteria bacterium]